MSHPLRPVFADSSDDREYPRRYFVFGGNSIVVLRSPRPADRAQIALTSLAQLRERMRVERTVPLGALIFHCSRCGSTLLARLLELDASNRVLAEPAALPKFLLAHSAALQRGEAIDELRAFITAFGLSPGAEERRLILKLTSLSTAYLPAFRAAFPDVPFIYLLREPGEVVASLRANPPPVLQAGMRSTLAAALADSPPDVSLFSPEEWFSWYVQRNLQLAWQHRERFSAVVDYTEHAIRYVVLANSISERNSPLDAAAVAHVMSFHSKNPAVGFTPAGQRDIPALLSATATRFAGDAYHRWRKEPKKEKGGTNCSA